MQIADNGRPPMQMSVQMRVPQLEYLTAAEMWRRGTSPYLLTREEMAEIQTPSPPLPQIPHMALNRFKLVYQYANQKEEMEMNSRLNAL